jgi:hypothetical protein
MNVSANRNLDTREGPPETIVATPNRKRGMPISNLMHYVIYVIAALWSMCLVKQS